MKPLITIMMIVLTALAGLISMPAVAKTKIVYVCPKHHKHYKKHKTRSTYRSYYVPGYCKSYCCNGCMRESCCPGYTYTCRTVYYYHHGRNTARVENCN